eukprot:scaffold100288_cov38-Prasinocladus_malaysianus.AAC.2
MMKDRWKWAVTEKLESLPQANVNKSNQAADLGEEGCEVGRKRLVLIRGLCVWRNLHNNVRARHPPGVKPQVRLRRRPGQLVVLAIVAADKHPESRGGGE